MAVSLNEELIDAVYRAALDPSAWNDVMQLMRGSFPSTAQTFYFLHRETQRLQPICVAGVQHRWLASFDELFFAPDNPWIRVTQSLHRPGIVRTTERLERFLREEGVLFRSAYYNDWMRPQGFKHNIGNTLLAEGGIVANITLFRPPDMPTFGDDEVRTFEELSRHMTRSLRMSIQLERTDKCPVSTAALDALPHPVALVDGHRHVLYANAAMETLLRSQCGLRSRQGELVATHAAAQQQLVAHLDAVLGRLGGARGSGEAMLLPVGTRSHLSLRAIPVHGSMARYLPAKQTLLLMVTECTAQRAVSRAAIEQLHGCTPREARLAQLLAEGCSLRQAADAMGITYGTARIYLKAVFQKTGARTQAQLVGRVLADGVASRSLLH
jgi:DNA-binding CsgD family transcriptional regulator/PAS domain-containing protein